MNKKIKIFGMHCKSCEVLLENELQSIAGIKINEINSNTGIIDVDIKNENDIEKIKTIIKDSGYFLENNKTHKNNFLDYTIIFLLFIIIGIIGLILTKINIFGNIIKFDNLSFIVILLIGLTASISSCLAVTGGIIIGFSSFLDKGHGLKSHLKIQAMFHFGRILGFTILGGILGGLGSFIGNIGLLNKVLLFLAGFLMIYIGFNMLKILPSISKFGITMPKVFAHKILNIKNPLFAPIVGVLTFFLPCGFTQSMQIYAISSGSFISGAMIMGIFALGTLPVLFLVGLGSSYFKEKKFDFLNKIIAIIVIYFGLFTLYGFSNFIHINPVSTPTTQENTSNTNLEETKTVTVSHNGDVLVPEEIVLEGAKKYTLIINPESDGLGCKYALTIPGIYETEHPIKKGVPIIINIENPVAGTYKVICTAMGMRHGVIIIK